MENSKFWDLWKEIKELFESIFKRYDVLWIERERKINTRFLVLFIFRLVIPKDERGYANTLLEIFNNFINNDIVGMPKTLAASSVCEARMKLDPEIFRELNEGIIKIWERYNEKPALWCGLNMYGVDGSKLLLPRELLDFGFKTEGKHVHYPHGLLSSVYDLHTGIPYDFSFVNHGNERACALEHLKKAVDNSLYIYDRGYFSFQLLSVHCESNEEALFRLQAKVRIKEIDDFWESDKTDTVVFIPPPEKLILKVKKGLCRVKLEPIQVRLIKYIINDKKYVLLSTLKDQEKYPESCFKEAYHRRWGHEEMLKVSKVITGVTDFHSKTELGIKQELFAHFVIVTLIKIIESQAHQHIEKKIENKKPSPRRLRRLENSNKGQKISTTVIAKKLPEEKREVQVNQKAIFLLIGWNLEKLIYFELNKYIEKIVDHIVESAEKIYQWFRPDRAYPRISRTPPTKWWRKRNGAPKSVPA